MGGDVSENTIANSMSMYGNRTPSGDSRRTSNYFGAQTPMYGAGAQTPMHDCI